MKFNPSRFLPQDHSDGIRGQEAEPDPKQLVFGFGRRVCPGRFLADATLSLTILQTLAVFRICKVKRNGKEVDAKAEFLPGLLSQPVDFEADIVPRYDGAERLVLAKTDSNSWPAGDSSKLNL
jgi:cytochrome P450